MIDVLAYIVVGFFGLVGAATCAVYVARPLQRWVRRQPASGGIKRRVG